MGIFEDKLFSENENLDNTLCYDIIVSSCEIVYFTVNLDRNLKVKSYTRINLNV